MLRPPAHSAGEPRYILIRPAPRVVEARRAMTNDTALAFLFSRCAKRVSEAWNRDVVSISWTPSRVQSTRRANAYPTFQRGWLKYVVGSRVVPQSATDQPRPTRNSGRPMARRMKLGPIALERAGYEYVLCGSGRLRFKCSHPVNAVIDFRSSVQRQDEIRPTHQRTYLLNARICFGGANACSRGLIETVAIPYRSGRLAAHDAATMAGGDNGSLVGDSLEQIWLGREAE